MPAVVRYSIWFNNPFTAPACQIPGLKSAYVHACKQKIISGPITNLLSVLCILMTALSNANAKGGESFKDVKISDFVDGVRVTVQ